MPYDVCILTGMDLGRVLDLPQYYISNSIGYTASEISLTADFPEPFLRIVL